MKKCSVCGSDDRVCKFKGIGNLLCAKHYNQMYRLGYTTNKPKKRRENIIKTIGKIVQIITVRGEKILVDKEDYCKVKNYYWSLNTQGYVISVIKGKQKRLHLMILDKPKGTVIDHINGDKKDNRKSNLRICTNWENFMNGKVSKSSKTGYLGVSLTQYGKYRARISIKGKEIRLGNFENIEDAIKARQEAEIKYFGKYAPTLCRKK